MHTPSLLKGESLKIILIILMGWSCFSFADVITKIISQDIPPAYILSFSGLLSASALVCWIFYNKGWRGFLSPNWKWLIGRAVCIGITATAMVNAVALIPLADLYGITFSAPFIIVIMAATLLKEHVGWHRWVCVCIGFMGVFILAGPQYETLNIGLVFAIAAALSISVGTILVRKIGRHEYMPLFILYPYIGILAVNLPLIFWGEITPPTDINFSGLLFNTFFVLGGQFCTTYGVSNAKNTAAIAPFVYIQIAWATLFGILIFHDIPTWTTMTGLALVVGAGIYMIYRERQLNKVYHEI